MGRERTAIKNRPFSFCGNFQMSATDSERGRLARIERKAARDEYADNQIARGQNSRRSSRAGGGQDVRAATAP